MRSLEEIIKLLCSYLDEKEIRYALVGGVTLPLLGAPRSTADIDIIVDIREEQVGGLTDFLASKGFFASEQDLLAALEEKSHCTIEDKDSPYRIDLKGAYSTREKETLEHAKQLEVLGIRVWMQDAEDGIAHKLLYGTEQDKRDAMTIYVRQLPRLDMSRLERLCKELGVSKELEEIKEEAKEYI